jgi:hypothetical protein
MSTFDDDLKRRMQLARSAGWGEDEINRSALIERAVENGKQKQQKTAQPKKQTSGRGGFLTSLISEGGATGGALAGAGLGSVVPGLGTILGGAIGGLVGGFGGSAVEQKVRDDKVDWGKAGMEGAFSAIPGGFGKSARVAGTVAKDVTEQNAARGGSELARFFSPQDGAISNYVREKGTNARAINRGAVPGGKMQGRGGQDLMPKEANEITKFLDQQGAKGSVPQQLDYIEKKQQEAGQAVNDIVGKAPKPVTSEDLYSAQNTIRNNLTGPKGIGGFDPATHGAIANRYAQQMAGIRDSKGWQDFKRSLDNDINYSRNSQSVDPKLEQVAEVFRKEAKDQVDRLHPEAVPHNKVYGQAETAKNVLVKQANPSGIKPFGTGINGQGFGGKTVQGGMDATGRGLQRAADITSTPAFTQLLAQMGISGITNTEQPGAAQQQVPDTMTNTGMQDQQDPIQALLSQAVDGGMTNFDDLAGIFNEQGASAQQQGDTWDPNDPTAANPPFQYSSTQLTNAALQALAAGDTAAYKQYADAASMVQGFEQDQAKAAKDAGGGGLNVTKVTSQNYSNAESGYSALQQIQQLIGSDPGVINRTAIPGKGLPIVGGVIANKAGTTNYDTLAYNVADKYIRLTTGATANADEVKKLVNQGLPRAGDTPEQAQFKLRQFAGLFESILGQAQQSGGSDPFEELMQQMQGGQQYAY